MGVLVPVPIGEDVMLTLIELTMIKVGIVPYSTHLNVLACCYLQFCLAEDDTFAFAIEALKPYQNPICIIRQLKCPDTIPAM